MTLIRHCLSRSLSTSLLLVTLTACAASGPQAVNQPGEFTGKIVGPMEFGQPGEGAGLKAYGLELRKINPVLEFVAESGCERCLVR